MNVGSTRQLGCRADTSSSRSNRACAASAPTTSTSTTRTSRTPTPRWSRPSSVYDDLVRQGKLRYVALSNHPAWQVTQALWIADDRRLAAAPVCAQVKYNLIDRAAEDELAPACQQFGLSIVPFGPLHGGLLAGMQVEEREIPVTRDSVGPGSPTPSWRSAVRSSG